MNARTAFDCISIGDNDATTLGHRAQHLTEVVIAKVSALRTRPVFAEEVLLGTVAQRLDDIPVADFDACRRDLDRHLKKHGCCRVRVKGDDYALTELQTQMGSAAEILEPYRKLIGGAR